MAKYKLCDWEENGYDDSDFFDAYYDDADGAVHKVETGSTRYAGNGFVADYSPLTPEALAGAIAWLTQAIYRSIRAAEHRDVSDPQPGAMHKGVRLVLTRAVSHKGKVYEPGTAGEVFWSGAYGKFYRNGYNRPNRENTRVGLRLDGGLDSDKIFVALSACKLARDPMSDAELLQRAADIAQNCNFGPAMSCKHAWDSNNYAQAYQTRALKAEVRKALEAA